MRHTIPFFLALAVGCQSDADDTSIEDTDVGETGIEDTDTDATGADETGEEPDVAYDGYDYLSHYAVMPDGLNMHYLDEGEGDPIVMVHGLPTQAYMWRRVIPTVADKGRVIAPDLINFGLSDKTDPVTPGQEVEYLTALIDELELENVTLVLHDWGVAIGLAYAANHTDNIKGVVFFEGPFSPLPGLAGIPEWFVPNMLDPVTARPNLVDDNWLIEGFLLDPAGGATSRIYTEAEKEVYRAPFTTPEEREQILLFPQYLPFLDTTGHPVLDPDGPGGEPPMPAPEIEISMGNAQFLQTADVPKLFIYGMPGTWANGNGAMLAGSLESSMLNLSSVQVGREDTPNYHYIAEDTPDELADAVVTFVQGL